MAITIPTPQTQGAAALGGMTAIAADTPMQNLQMPDMGSTGRSLEKLGGAMATYAAHVKRIDDERRLLEFQVAWGEFERQALYDPDTGLMGLEGRDAFGSVESIRTRADEFMLSWQEEAGRLSGTARLAIDQYGVRSVESLLTRAAAREFQERERYNASLRAASTAAAQDRAVRNYSNPEQFALDVALAEATARSEAEATVRSSANAFSTGQAISFADYGAQAGEQQVDDPLQFGGFEEANDQAAAVQAAHAELIDTEVHNSVSQIYVRAIEESVSAGGGQRRAGRSQELLAEALDNNYISHDSPIVTAVRFHTQDAAAHYLVTSAVGENPGNIAAQMRHIQTASHVQDAVREEAASRLNAQVRWENTVREQETAAINDDLTDRVLAGEAYGDLPRGELARLSAAQRTALQNIGAVTVDDPATADTAWRVAANPESLTQEYIASLSDRLTPATLVKLREIRAEYLRERRTGGTRSAGDTTSAITGAINNLGLDSDDPNTVLLRARAQDWARAHQDAGSEDIHHAVNDIYVGILRDADAIAPVERRLTDRSWTDYFPARVSANGVTFSWTGFPSTFQELVSSGDIIDAQLPELSGAIAEYNRVLVDNNVRAEPIDLDDVEAVRAFWLGWQATQARRAAQAEANQ